MKSIVIFLLTLFAPSKCKEAIYPRIRRGSFQSSYPLQHNLQIGGVDVNTYGKEDGISLHSVDLLSSGVDDFLPIQPFQQANVNVKVDLTRSRPQRRPLHQIPGISYPVSNSIDKPVQEAQDYIPPQSIGTAIIPPMPPPAIPVNAAAANVPSERGAVFLGSGSLGVIDLGGGTYALGSGSLGYSRVRSNPRSSFKAPLLPPVQAAPNLVPAAVPSPEPLRPSPFDFGHPLLENQPSVQQSGYEYLPPNRVGFGDPLPPRPLKTTMAYATPSNSLGQPQLSSYQPALASSTFGQRVNVVNAVNNQFYH